MEVASGQPVFLSLSFIRWRSECSVSFRSVIMVLRRFRTESPAGKLALQSRRNRMKHERRDTGCPEAISSAILGHGSNTVATNYGSGYALDVMREHMEKVWA